MTQARINQLLSAIDAATTELKGLLSPKVALPDPNPSYDGTALYWLTKPWYRTEKLSYAQIANRLNELGYRTKNGKAWSWIDASALVND
jgi:hypothetical protein